LRGRSGWQARRLLPRSPTARASSDPGRQHRPLDLIATDGMTIATMTSQQVQYASPPPSPLPYRVARQTQTQTQQEQQQMTQMRRLQSPSKRKARSEPMPKAMVMVGMIFFGLLMALLIMAFFAYAPLLCLSWLGIMYVIVLYLSTESNWRWHDAQEFENRFWTMTAFVFSSAVVYVRDSPLAVGQWNSTLGLFIVFSFTTAVHFFDRFLHRQEISRIPRLNMV
jgi:hypothetical protein